MGTSVPARALIWYATRTYNDMKFCKEAKTITVFEKWLNSLKNKSTFISFFSSPNHTWTPPNVKIWGCRHLFKLKIGVEVYLRHKNFFYSPTSQVN